MGQGDETPVCLSPVLCIKQGGNDWKVGEWYIVDRKLISANMGIYLFAPKDILFLEWQKFY